MEKYKKRKLTAPATPLQLIPAASQAHGRGERPCPSVSASTSFMFMLYAFWETTGAPANPQYHQPPTEPCMKEGEEMPNYKIFAGSAPRFLWTQVGKGENQKLTWLRTRPTPTGRVSLQHWSVTYPRLDKRHPWETSLERVRVTQKTPEMP